MTEQTSEQGFDGVSEPRLGRSVSLDHAAEILGVSRRTVYNRIREGRLQTIRTIGGPPRAPLDSVQDGLTPPQPTPRPPETPGWSPPPCAVPHGPTPRDTRPP